MSGAHAHDDGLVKTMDNIISFVKDRGGHVNGKELLSEFRDVSKVDLAKMLMSLEVGNILTASYTLASKKGTV